VKRRFEKTIGVFTAELNDSYQASVWQGISTQAEAEEIGLICFLGSRLNSPLIPEKSANHIYELATEQNLDGLIVISSAISTYLEIDTLKRFFKTKKSLPLISIGLKVPGVPSVTVNGRDGLKAIVKHLIKKHRRKNFALIAGPREHEEAEDRKRAFFDTLDNNKIAFDKRLYFEGTFEKSSGVVAVRRFVRCGRPFDAIVCLNDKMALGALEELRESGIDVPGRVSLVGFDGSKVAEYSNPPITTVFQPVSELGAEAVKMICSLIEGKTGKGVKDRLLGCQPIIRESCGCRQRLVPSRDEIDSFEENLAPEEKLLKEKLLKLAVSLRTNDFLMLINQEVSRALLEGDRIPWFHTLVYLIQQRVLGNLERNNDGEAWDAYSDLFTKAFTLLGESHSRFEASKRIAAMEQASKVRAISIAISEEFEIPVVLDRLFSGLAALGFEEAYLVLYEGMRRPHTWSRLFTGTEEHTTEGIRFRTESILPENFSQLWSKHQWVILPLVFQYEDLGYLLLPAHIIDPEHYGTLSKQLASTLKGRRLLEQVRKHERSLEEEVAKRTVELVGTNRQLTEEINRRIRLEKEVIDTSNMIMERIGQDLHDDLCQHLAGISMMVTAFKSSFEPGSVTAEFTDQISRLLMDSIDHAKGIARSLAPVGLREEGLVAAIDALIESIRKRCSIELHFQYDPTFRFVDIDRSIQLYRIVQEALMNAVKHAKCSRIDVLLSVDASRESSSPRETGDNQKLLSIEVVDNGIGVPAGISGKGMGLRIMQYRAEIAQANLSVTNLEPGGKGTRVACTFS
jgi:DNA-binding LacI/PurR family transcriptional regulator/signal transduction histidine kinase